MNVNADLAAVESRIDAISGFPSRATTSDIGALAGARPPRARTAAFASLVNGAYEELAKRAGRDAGVDPALVVAVTQTESGFDPRATSSVGAAGLMQLMPATANALGVADPYDPVQNVRGGAAYLHQLLERFHHSIPLAVAAYNSGPGAVERYGGIPPYAETQAYVRRVMDAYRARRGM